MILNDDQMDILKIYICKTKSATIHNLDVAHAYFSHTSEAHTLSSLTGLIRNMTNYEFERWYKIIASETII